MPKASKRVSLRRVAEVSIGDRYRVNVSGEIRAVEILSRESSGVWRALNTDTGRFLYVTFADLGERLPASHSSADERLRAAAGDRDDL